MLLKTPFGDFIRHLNKLTEDKLWQIAITNSVTAQMHDLNLQQLDKGYYSDGSDTPDYSMFTEQLKKAEGKIYQHMNFDDTGFTRSSIKYVRTKDGVKITIKDRYKLLQNYSENIIGLTNGSIEFLKDEIIENIQEAIKNY